MYQAKRRNRGAEKPVVSVPKLDQTKQGGYLTYGDVRVIRSMQGSRTAWEVSRLYNITRQNVYLIWNRKTWRDA